MHIICDKTTLSAALGMVQRAVAIKSPLPTLKGVHLETVDSGLNLSATDLEFGIRCMVNTDVKEHGSVVLPAKLLTEFVKKLPEGPVTLKSDESNPLKINISSHNIRFDISGFSSEEFPRLPGIKNNETTLDIPEGLLKEMLIQTEIAIAKDETRPVLTGLLMECTDNKLKFVSTDGHRLAFRQAPLEGNHNLKAILPGKAVQELVKILEEDLEKKVTIILDKSDIVFQLDGIVISSRLVEGNYPPYQQIIPTDFKTTLEIDTKEAMAALERAEIVAREGGKNLVKMDIVEEGIKISSNSPDIGTFEDFIQSNIQGEELEIRFNVKILLDCIKNIRSHQVNVDFTGSFSPCMIRPVAGHNYLHLVMPVRIS